MVLTVPFQPLTGANGTLVRGGLIHRGQARMINNGAELTDVQGHLGHEKITTTVDVMAP
ncbi:hypothetical protein IU498_06480 [Nocardia beijingensis]|uniref:hypothetical protein n=1 Tax=Nocardia beijingensis TaxID=95162 RepID=UPI00189331C2|nr:hypothetical protein [Nocardia beijingensis]MBF6074275.1 hypothetical protein [Nocardia beijingensis]